MIIAKANDTNRLPGGGGGGGTSFFGRLLRRAVNLGLAAARAMGGLGSLIAEGADALINDSWQNQRMGIDLDNQGYEPTASESAAIDAFMSGKFNPFFKSLIMQLEAAIANNNIDVQLQGINRAMAIMDAVKIYYNNRPAPFLSASALKSRMDSMGVIFLAMDNLVRKMLDENPNSFEISQRVYSATPADFTPLEVPAGNYTVTAYAKQAGSVSQDPLVPKETLPKLGWTSMLLLAGIAGLIAKVTLAPKSKPNSK